MVGGVQKVMCRTVARFCRGIVADPHLQALLLDR